MIRETTARQWLHQLWFTRIHHQKRVYFDGHNLENVIAYRLIFLGIMNDLDKISLTCLDNMPQFSHWENPLIRAAHDECVFYPNCNQTLFGADDRQMSRDKSHWGHLLWCQT